MQTPATFGARLRYQEYDRIPITEDVPVLGVEEGDEGVISGLHLDNEIVLAFVAINYCIGQMRVWVILRSNPRRRSVPTRPFRSRRRTALVPTFCDQPINR